MTSALFAFNLIPPQWGTADAGIKSHLSRTQSSVVLPFQPRAGLCTAMRTTPISRDFSLPNCYPSSPFTCILTPQWGAADAEIKVPSGENTELKRSPFIVWSRSVYSHTCYTYCQGVLPCLFLPFQSIHLHFFQNLSQFFPVLACRIKQVTLLDAGSRVECLRHINRLKKHDLWMDDDL